jgi:hypothetical protein
MQPDDIHILIHTAQAVMYLTIGYFMGKPQRKKDKERS